MSRPSRPVRLAPNTRNFIVDQDAYDSWNSDAYIGGVDNQSMQKKRKRDEHSTLDAEPENLEQLIERTSGQQIKQATSVVVASRGVKIANHRFTVNDVLQWLENGQIQRLQILMNSAFSALDPSEKQSSVLSALKAMRRLWEFIAHVVDQMITAYPAWSFQEQKQRLLRVEEQSRTHAWDHLTLAVNTWNDEFIARLIKLSDNEPSFWLTLMPELISPFQKAYSSRWYSSTPPRNEYGGAMILNLWLKFASHGLMAPGFVVFQEIVTYVERDSMPTRSQLEAIKSGPVQPVTYTEGIGGDVFADLWYLFEHNHRPTVETRPAYLLFAFQEYVNMVRRRESWIRNNFSPPPLYDNMLGKYEQWYPDYYRNAQYIKSLSASDREILFLWTEHCGVVQSATECSTSTAAHRAYARRRMDGIFENAPRVTVPMYVYRGVMGSDDQEVLLKAVSRSSFYLATSFDVRVSYAFRDQDFNCCMFRILVPVGMPFIFVDEHVSAFGTVESEVIFPRNLQLIASSPPRPADQWHLSAVQDYFGFMKLQDVTLQPQQQVTVPEQTTTTKVTETDAEIWDDLMKHVRSRDIKKLPQVLHSIRVWQIKWYGVASESDSEQHAEFRKLAHQVLEKLPDYIFDKLKLSRTQAQQKLETFKLF